MLSSINNSTKHSDIAYQYIQSDIDKMNAIAFNIEQTANRLIPLVPPNLQNDISSLKKTTQQLSNSYSAFDYKKYKNKLKMTKDSLEHLSQKVLLHINDDSEFGLTKNYADSFYNDVKTRILDATKQQCSNLEFCVDSELKIATNKPQSPVPIKKEIPQFDTPSPKTIFYRKKTSANENEKIVYAIKDQTKRLSDIYSQITELKSLQKDKKVDNNDINLPSLVKLQEDNTRILKEIEMLYHVLNIKNNSRSKKAKEKTDVEYKLDVVMKDQLDSFENLSNSMIQAAKTKFEEAKSKVKEEIQMIKARLEILENRINEYGDFSGETNEMMTYIGMKVDEVVNDNESLQNDGNLNEIKNNEELTNIYLDIKARIAKVSIESQLDSIKKSIRYIQFNKPLIA